MKTENVLLWIAGGFVVYKLLFQPKATTLPGQSLPVYTPSGANIQTTNTGSTSGSLLALGTGLVTSIIKAINPGTTVAQPAGSTTVDQTQQAATNDFIDNQVSDIFSPGIPTALLSGIQPAIYFNNVNEDDLD